MVVLMSMQTIREHDVVALTEDLPSERLVRGQVGTVVHVYGPDDFEVEFADRDGRTYAMATVGGRKLLLLHHEPVGAG